MPMTGLTGKRTGLARTPASDRLQRVFSCMNSDRMCQVISDLTRQCIRSSLSLSARACQRDDLTCRSHPGSVRSQQCRPRALSQRMTGRGTGVRSSIRSLPVTFFASVSSPNHAELARHEGEGISTFLFLSKPFPMC
jgi:hypothetical protein